MNSGDRHGGAMGRGEALNSVPSTSFGIFPREPVSSRRAFLSGCDYHCNPSSQETPESITGAHLVITEPRSYQFWCHTVPGWSHQHSWLHLYANDSKILSPVVFLSSRPPFQFTLLQAIKLEGSQINSPSFFPFCPDNFAAHPTPCCELPKPGN